MTTLGTVFVADVHLGLEVGPRHALFLSFLKSVARQGHTLCLLGDIFDIWVKPAHPRFPAYRPILDELSTLSSAGVTVHFFEGNRDYFGSGFLSTYAGAVIHKGPRELRMEGRRVLVCHGDSLCAADTHYRFVRALTRNRFIHAVFTALPADVNYYLANGYKRYSKHARARKQTREMDLSAASLLREFRQGAQDIVCGHVHRSCVLVPKAHHRFGSEVGAVYVSGNWSDISGCYLALADGHFTFHRFPAGDAAASMLPESLQTGKRDE